jgi:hypothetical protein
LYRRVVAPHSSARHSSIRHLPTTRFILISQEQSEAQCVLSSIL